MRVLISGWVGSTNLGDELVFAGVRRLLGREARITAVSIDPAATRRAHGVSAIDHRHLDRIRRAARQADVVVLGGGGLIQDETSALNLPYHLSRPALAALGGTPVVGLALGVGPLHTRLGRQLAATLRRAEAVSVRDEPSKALLRAVGVDAVLASDAALHLAPDAPSVDASGRMPPRRRVEGEASPLDGDGRGVVVSLRPWTGVGGRLPVAWQRGAPEPAWLVPRIAAALDEVVARTGRHIRFVALQTDRDAALHDRIVAAMRAPATAVVPTLRSVLEEVGSGEVVLAMRYHAGVAATLAGRPSVLIGYSTKVDALAGTLGAGAVHLPFTRDALAGLADAVVTQTSSTRAATAVCEARTRLVTRSAANLEVLRGVLR